MPGQTYPVVKQYLDLVRDVLEKGTRKPNRTGVDTLSTFNHNYEIDLRAGLPAPHDEGDLLEEHRRREPLVPQRRDAHRPAQEARVQVLGPVGRRRRASVPSAYGNFWRHFPVHDAEGRAAFNDQIAWVARGAEAQPDEPAPRGHRVGARATRRRRKLPPCHLLFVFNVQLDERGDPLLCLHLTQRSADVALGVPYNIAGYALLLELFSRFTGIRARASSGTR